MKKSRLDYVLEAMGLGLLFGAVGLGAGIVFTDSIQRPLLVGLVGFLVGAGLRLAVGRDLKATEKPDRGEP